MLLSIFILLLIVSCFVSQAQDSQSISTHFRFTEEAQAALCPFVGYEGMRCFDSNHIKRSGRQGDSGMMKLPRGVGMSVHQVTGEIKALAVELTYTEEGSRVWSDGYTGLMYDTINEATIGPAARIVEAFDASRILIFQNASQIHAAWRQRFVDGKIRGGKLANRPDMLEYSNEYFKKGEAAAISQRPVGLYTLRLNASTVRLNPFARHALSRLTTTYDPDLYEAFIDVWGTHVITRSLIGGMIEEQAKIVRCYRAADDSMFARCIPFGDRHSTDSPSCNYYASQAQVISKRYLGGKANTDVEHEWKKTLGAAPALVQILEMVPWYDFITNGIVKKNLQSAIHHRHKNIDSNQAEAVRQIDARLFPCTTAPYGLPDIKADASWNRNGITIAGGNGAGALPYQLNYPVGLFHDGDETLYIVDYKNHRVLEWKVGAGTGRVVAGGHGEGSAANQFQFPEDVIVDKARNSLIVSDFRNYRIVRWSLLGEPSGETIINDGQYICLTLDEEGSLYFSDIGRHQVAKRQFGKTQRVVVIGGNGTGSQLNQLNSPRHIVVDRNRSVYVADMYNHRVMKLVNGANEGIIVAGGNGEGSSLSQLAGPHGIAIDKFENVYVADRFNHRIMRWPKGARQGQILIGGLGAGSQPNQLNDPIGLAFDRDGNMFVSDWVNHRVQKFEIS